MQNGKSVPKEPLELDVDRGAITVEGHRALLIDAVAMGPVRALLAEEHGAAPARTLLTHFAFAHGWKVANANAVTHQWEKADDWRLSELWMHCFGGLFRLEPGAMDPLSPDGVTMSISYEAQQQLHRSGESDDSACWILCALMSGYLTRSHREQIYVVEDRCVAKGDPDCHLIGKTREAWGDSMAEELAYFKHTESGMLPPFGTSQSLVEALERLLANLALPDRPRAAPALDEPSGMIARSRAFQSLIRQVRRVAKVDSTVLVMGESGTGKERIARLLHDASARSTGPFVAVNCGAIVETLLEAELFGHVRGAFTGATCDRAGLFEAADGGTIHLDEIGEMPLAMQVKLLRVLQEREVRRVGDNKSRPVDVRVVAATNRDLSLDVAERSFRQDLYYRLKVVELHVPPLRERREDLLPLAHALLAEAALRMNHAVAGISAEAADRLLAYSWPGNVRELANTMERAVALTAGQSVALEDLPEEIQHPSSVSPSGASSVQPLEEIEREYILAALRANGGNQTHTALQLQIGAATLYRKLKRYGLTSSRPPAAETETET